MTLCMARMYIYILAVPCTQPLYMHLEHIKDIYMFLGVGKNSPGTQRVKEHSKFQNFCEIFYYDMTRPRSMNFSVFIQYQDTTILRKKIWDTVCLRNIENFKISMKYQQHGFELLNQRKLWDRVFLKII